MTHVITTVIKATGKEGCITIQSLDDDGNIKSLDPSKYMSLMMLGSYGATPIFAESEKAVQKICDEATLIPRIVLVKRSVIEDRLQETVDPIQ